MAVRIGKIELVGLTHVATEDTRNIVQQRGPGQSGSVTQDLGREPITVVMEGTLYGDDTADALEELRDAQAKGKPLSFAADAIAGAALTDVLIADLRVTQLPGYRSRFAFFLRVREHTEPPEDTLAGAAAVDRAAEADAATWAGSATDAASVLKDPATLMAMVAANPAALAELTPAELGSVLDEIQSALSGRSFTSVLGALGKLDPSLIAGLIDAIESSGSIGELVEKLAGEGIALLKELTGIDLGEAADAVKALAGAADFLARLQRVGEDAKTLADTLAAFEPLAPYTDLDAPAAGGSP